MTTSHEDLLAPALHLVAKRGTVKVGEAVRILAGQASDYNPSRPEPGTVESALRSLSAAELIKWDHPSLTITDAGKLLADTRPTNLTFEDLEKYPRYTAYCARLRRDHRRRKYLNLRFDYYVAGRLLFFRGSSTAAAVLLGYAIEYHLKAALAEFEESWTPRERKLAKLQHNLRGLYEACLGRGVLDDTFVSRDFLDYAHDHFERRYPSKERELLEDRGYWRFGGSLLHTYDDCITQLDTGLAKTSGSTAYHLGVRAITASNDVSDHLADAFFHGNVFAIEQIPLYKQDLPKWRREILSDETIERPDLLLSREGLPHPGLAYVRAREVADWNLAAFFRYPEIGEPDPDPARLLANQVKSPLALGSSRWVVDRAVAAFGHGAVDVSEDNDHDRIVLTVFDRRAKKWHRSLTLKTGLIDHFIRSERNEEMVDRFINDARSTFARLRRNLRVPPKRGLGPTND